MSVINTNIPTTVGVRHLNQSQEALGRSLHRLSSASPQLQFTEDSAAIRDARKMDALRVNAQSASIQNSLSYVQTTDRFMHGKTQALSCLSELANLVNEGKGASDVAIHRLEFKALQDQLRDTIGGSAAEIGGTNSVASPQGTFNGQALFGPSSNAVALEPAETAGERIDFPDTNLRGRRNVETDPTGCRGQLRSGCRGQQRRECCFGRDRRPHEPAYGARRSRIAPGVRGRQVARRERKSQRGQGWDSRFDCR